MNKKFAFILAILITLLIASNYSFFKITGNQIKNEREFVSLSRVIDGDTIEIEGGRKIRLLNVNAPEKNVKGSEMARDFLKNYETEIIELEVTGIDKYDRELARIYHENSYLNLELVRQGLSSKFLVDDKELKSFDKAENFAILNALGIWNKSNYFDCFSSEINSKKEYLVLINTCEMSLNKWTLKDESRKTYTFKNITFKKINLHSGIGKDNSTDLFWNSNANIWNNDRDSVYLFDEAGNIVHSKSYGYD